VAGFDHDQVDKPGVYASDDDTFTMTDNGTVSATSAGPCAIVSAAAWPMVAFDAEDAESRASRGAGGQQRRHVAGWRPGPAISATYVQSEIRNSIASLADEGECAAAA
jgi:hypothetical protein